MRGLLLAMTTATMAVLAADAATPKMDGWFPCAEVTFADEDQGNASGSGSGASPMRAECATFKAPLCYDGVCTADANTTTEIDVFVKRINAVAPGKPNIFFLQGGPGIASSAMESAMTGVYSLLKGNVNVYTMDHRGTGRSTKLDCVAAQAMTSGSPSGASIDPTEVASCAADLDITYGTDRASFSTTSAASDLHLFITSFLNDSTTFVYGVSYGTSLVERLMHLNTTGIGGYILDGISTTSGSDAKNFEYFSKWDTDYNEVAQYFFSYCAKNQDDCGKYFKDASLSDTLQTLTTNLDSPNYKCSAPVDAMFAELYSYTPGSVPPSESLRMFFGTLFADAALRKLIPVITYRLTRCNADDVKVVAHLVQHYAADASQKDESDQYQSDLVYKLIVYSEFWETPSPSSETMAARFAKTTVSSGSAGQVENYCVFSKENSPGCTPFANETDYMASPLIYKRDKYWNVAASPPKGVSVLLMSSKMDPQTPHKYAEYLLAALDTDNKQLVVFDQATHATLWSTPLSNTDPNAPICGMMLVASYVAVGGDLAKMDASCVAKMPRVSFAVSDKMRKNWLKTNAAFDGAFMMGTASGGVGDEGDGTTSYKTVFIVFLVLFVLALTAAMAFLFQWRKARKTAQQLQHAPVYEQETQA